MGRVAPSPIKGIEDSMKCSDCVWWIMNRCEGQDSPCNDHETYDDWDKFHLNVGEIE